LGPAFNTNPDVSGLLRPLGIDVHEDPIFAATFTLCVGEAGQTAQPVTLIPPETGTASVMIAERGGVGKTVTVLHPRTTALVTPAAHTQAS